MKRPANGREVPPTRGSGPRAPYNSHAKSTETTCIPNRRRTSVSLVICARLGDGVEGSIDFRKYAGECVRLAGLVQTDEDKAVLLSMAQAWIRLADEGPRIEALLEESSGQGS